MKDEPVNPFKCACGKTHSISAAHYDRVIVECQRVFFILRPQRAGPLFAKPHPGPNLTRQEMKERYPQLQEAA